MSAHTQRQPRCAISLDALCIWRQASRPSTRTVKFKPARRQTHDSNQHKKRCGFRVDWYQGSDKKGLSRPGSG
eukprot:1251038-Rhodomonas_salina.1